MTFSVIIPARFASTRLPGKPLLDIAGKPMIQRVYEQACKSEARQVIVATDDARIEAACLEFGAEVVLTQSTHPSGTDRLEEVVRRLGFAEEDIVVNVQGDEPLIPSCLINQVARNLQSSQSASISTLCEEITEAQLLFNPNVVKVVFDREGLAGYFSRAPIPWARDSFASFGQANLSLPEGAEYFRHIGIYGYRVAFLKQYVTWQPSPWEQLESLEQLRALYNGHRIHVAVAETTPPAGVDTQDDLERIRALFTQ
ncbi:MAG: 3-deoxy-manno-octulosonate cytidylyltransferase [Hahellaceae bacterium]|nr:3-deoxy-manno-octulosonate cytidylyltransferase [Hahellaceae bacterium]